VCMSVSVCAKKAMQTFLPYGVRDRERKCLCICVRERERVCVYAKSYVDFLALWHE